ncbi:ferritin-like metal-binding protein YciE [Pedobacter psychrotolerans]|uniref:Ferritin-like metal-binding protein YciE n=1 Tax=Pedobacter psychrotolerans TaxID=1843235 RepID=A0A4R2HPA1_9SPHI|nr:ferritin-like domain-containing protein [Pedobacter psychrotolerans]TCO31234.1 ferritin-like metal-binding protein YciE [Pedobacter psychrotolerans]GGE41212.1 YciE/YciF family protein [Pedobacter psychrotolerans]
MATTKTTAKKATTSKTAPTSKASTSKASTSKKATTKTKTGKMEDSEFHEFFVDELKDIYWAEKHLVKALPKMKKAATSEELIAAFEKHTEETQQHIQTLEQVFELLGEKAAAKKCEAMAGLLEEAEGIISETDKGTMVRDAGLILAAQKVEHYEIATYGTLKVFAENMGHQDVADLLSQTLENEKATDVALTEIAVSSINAEAAAE